MKQKTLLDLAKEFVETGSFNKESLKEIKIFDPEEFDYEIWTLGDDNSWFDVVSYFEEVDGKSINRYYQFHKLVNKYKESGK